jgi:DNA invertase Pin-like site-specific DNA recombinase
MKTKRCALYGRVSTLDQHSESQLNDIRQMAKQRGWTVVGEYVDEGVSGVRARRPQLDRMMSQARRGQFDVVLVWAFDRMARSVKHLLEVLEELKRLNIEFVSFRENIDTGGALGQALMVIIGAIAELERSLIIERVRSGMRRAKIEGRRIGRKPVAVDPDAVLRDRARGLSVRELAETHHVSKSTVHRLLGAATHAVPKGAAQGPLQVAENTRPELVV